MIENSKKDSFNYLADDFNDKGDSDFGFSFRNQCDKCNKYFTQIESLKRHREICKGTDASFQSKNESIGSGDDILSTKEEKNNAVRGKVSHCFAD